MDYERYEELKHHQQYMQNKSTTNPDEAQKYKDGTDLIVEEIKQLLAGRVWND